MDELKKLIKSYEAWVAANPETVCDFETTTKWISYFVAGRISDSNVLSELIYALSNLMVFYNDRIIDKSNHHLKHLPAINYSGSAGAAASSSTSVIVAAQHKNNNKNQENIHRLKVMLTTLEYFEVFIEITAKRLFGHKGKWLFIVLVQFTKAASRYRILQNATEKIITSPAMPSLNRRAWLKQQKSAALMDGSGGGIAAAAATNGVASAAAENDFTFQLKRSGRVIRKVEGAPPIQYRDFKLPDAGQLAVDGHASTNNALIQAEYLYIAKPLIHLAAMGVFGQKRWKQYIISLAVDLLSIRLYQQQREHMSKEQKLELSRRCVQLLLYLMRSPFYERVTRSRLDRALGFVVDNVPLVRMVAAPIREYIPFWQDTYFYLWST